jgi:hypothetical protein
MRQLPAHYLLSTHSGLRLSPRVAKGDRVLMNFRLLNLVVPFVMVTAELDGVTPLRGFAGDMSDSRDVVLRLDLNGDKKDDLLYYRPGKRYAGAYLSDGYGKLKYIPYASAENGWTANYNNFSGDVSDTRDRAAVLDFNGDGKDDFLWYRPGTGWAGIFTSNGDGTLSYVHLHSPGQSYNDFGHDVMSEADTAVPLDLNGDGKDDFLWYRPGSGYAGAYLSVAGVKVKYVSYSAPNAPGQNGFAGDVSNPLDRAVPLDINGDGKDDFLWYRPGSDYAGVHIAGTEGRLTYVSYREPGRGLNGFAGVGSFTNQRDTVLPLDINGDGRDDFLWYRPGEGLAAIYIASRVTGLVSGNTYSDGTNVFAGWAGDVRSWNDRAIAGDFNGDGRHDIFWYRAGSGYAGVNISQPGDAGVVKYSGYAEPGFRAHGFRNNTFEVNEWAFPLDMNGDGLTDLFWYRPGGGYANAYLAQKDPNKPLEQVPLQNYSYLTHPSSWMEDLGEELIGDAMLRSLAMPGSHDSGTYGILSGSAAKNQSLSFYGQLMQGVRYFDFRVMYNNGDFEFYHGDVPAGVKLGTAFADISRFLGEHPGEIVLLDQGNVWPNGLSNQDYMTRITSFENIKDRLIGIDDLKPYFSDDFCPMSSPNINHSTISCMTMGDLAKVARTGKQIFILYPSHWVGDQATTGANWNKVWAVENSVKSDYTATGVQSIHWPALDELSMARLRGKPEQSGKIWVLYTMLSGGTIPEAAARVYNPIVRDRLRNEYSNRLLNIAAHDFVEMPGDGELGRASIDLNLQPERHCGNYSGKRSLRSDQPVTVTFRNRWDYNVKLHWIDFDGVLREGTTIPAGDMFTGSTFVTHPFIITRDDGKTCVAAFTPQWQAPNGFVVDW